MEEDRSAPKERKGNTWIKGRKMSPIRNHPKTEFCKRFWSILYLQSQKKILASSLILFYFKMHSFWIRRPQINYCWTGIKCSKGRPQGLRANQYLCLLLLLQQLFHSEIYESIWIPQSQRSRNVQLSVTLQTTAQHKHLVKLWPDLPNQPSGKSNKSSG